LAYISYRAYVFGDIVSHIATFSPLCAKERLMS